MKFFGHLLLADIRRFRMLLGIWVALIAGAVLVDGVRPLFASEPQLREPLAVISTLLWWSRLLLTIILVPLIVQADAAVGTTAFWMTRPIPRLSIAIEKLILVIGAMVAVPAIAQAAVMRTHGFSAGTIAGVVFDGSVIAALMILMLAVAAALTSGFARFAILIGGALASVAILIGTLIAIEMARLRDQPPISVGPFETDPTDDVVFNVLVIGVLCLAVAVQYLARQRVWTILTGVVTAAIAYLVTSGWPWPFLKPTLLMPPSAEASVNVAVDESTIATHHELAFFPDQRVQWSTVRGRVNISGLAPGWSADMTVRDAAVQLDDGVVLRSRIGPRSMLVGGDHLHPPEVLRDVLHVNELRLPVRPFVEQQPGQRPALFMMRQPDLAPHARATGAYQARVSVSFTNFVVEAVLPIEVGARHRGPAYRLVIDRVERSDQHVMAVARESRASTVWHKRPSTTYSFYFRNRARSEAMPAIDYDMTGAFSMVSSLMPGFSLGGAEPQRFVSRAVAVTQRPPAAGWPRGVDSEWLASAELVVVRRTDEGSITRDLRVSQFPLGNPPPAVDNRP